MKSLIEEFDQIIAPVERQMMETVWHVLGDAHDAEDAFQDALTIILKRLKRVAKHNNPHALVAKICAEYAYDHCAGNSAIHIVIKGSMGWTRPVVIAARQKSSPSRSYDSKSCLRFRSCHEIRH